MRYVWSVWPALHKRIQSARRKLLILDFDGTIVPIAKTPDSVLFTRKSRKLVADLSRRRGWRVAVISGRSLKNLRRYFRDKRLIYAGNHGLELAGEGVNLPSAARKIRARTRLIRLLREKLNGVFYFWPGVMVEDKTYALGLHFRNLRPDRRPVFNELVNFYREKYRNHPIAWKRGKKVWEVRPDPGWGKGDMALYLAKKFRRSLAIAIGDDKTDEDTFKAMKHCGVTIRVGRSKKSFADYYLKSPSDVGTFLNELCRL